MNQIAFTAILFVCFMCLLFAGVHVSSGFVGAGLEKTPYSAAAEPYVQPDVSEIRLLATPYPTTSSRQGKNSATSGLTYHLEMNEIEFKKLMTNTVDSPALDTREFTTQLPLRYRLPENEHVLLEREIIRRLNVGRIDPPFTVAAMHVYSLRVSVDLLEAIRDYSRVSDFLFQADMCFYRSGKSTTHCAEFTVLVKDGGLYVLSSRYIGIIPQFQALHLAPRKTFTPLDARYAPYARYADDEDDKDGGGGGGTAISFFIPPAMKKTNGVLDGG